MVDNLIIKQMLEKAGVNPFYFGGGNESYFWRVAEIDDEIFAERTQVVGNCRDMGYYCCSECDKESRLNMYYDIVIDFVTYYSGYWRNNVSSDVFEAIAGPNDEDLLSILDVLHKKYSDFLNDVMYWFANIVETSPDNSGAYEVVRSCTPRDDIHLIRAVLRRFATSCPITIDAEDVEYIWQLASTSGEIWYKRTTRCYCDNYIFISEEYGRVPRKDEDACAALRDAVRSCFFIEGWEITEGSGEDVDAMLATVDLSLDELSV